LLLGAAVRLLIVAYLIIAVHCFCWSSQYVIWELEAAD